MRRHQVIEFQYGGRKGQNELTEAQRLTLQVSEARQALNGLIEARNKLPDGQEPDAESIRRMDEATRRVTSLETEYRAAVVIEAGEQEKRDQDAPDGEEVERRRLLARSSVVPFILEATEQRALDGAERECRAAVLGDLTKNQLTTGGIMMPIDLLLPPDEVETRAQTEYRADTVTPVDSAALADGSQASVLERIFTRSVAARLGVSMPSVPVGASVFPIMTGGTTASMAADETQVDAAAGTFTGHTLEPVRLTAAYLFNMRQSYQLRNFEQILRRDLAAVMSDAMDNQIINGNGTAPNVTGFLHELTAPTRPNAACFQPAGDAKPRGLTSDCTHSCGGPKVAHQPLGCVGLGIDGMDGNGGQRFGHGHSDLRATITSPPLTVVWEDLAAWCRAARAKRSMARRLPRLISKMVS